MKRKQNEREAVQFYIFGGFEVTITNRGEGEIKLAISGREIDPPLCWFGSVKEIKSALDAIVDAATRLTQK